MIGKLYYSAGAFALITATIVLAQPAQAGPYDSYDKQMICRTVADGRLSPPPRVSYRAGMGRDSSPDPAECRSHPEWAVAEQNLPNPPPLSGSGQ